METAYFNADYVSPINTFLKYGSLVEYKYFLKHLDYFATTVIWDDEELEIFDLITNIIERTNDSYKINKAHTMYDEYIKSEKILYK